MEGGMARRQEQRSMDGKMEAEMNGIKRDWRTDGWKEL